jgi:hypothetical protein
VLAYAEAVHRLQDGWKFLATRKTQVELPAPELDLVPPNERVEHYMNKLRTYLFVGDGVKEIYDDAARVIQHSFRTYAWRKTLKNVKSKV